MDALTAVGPDPGRGGGRYRCPHCGAELEPAVPLFAGSGVAWYWRLRHEWLAERLARATDYDQQHAEVTL